MSDHGCVISIHKKPRGKIPKTAEPRQDMKPAPMQCSKMQNGMKMTQEMSLRWKKDEYKTKEIKKEKQQNMGTARGRRPRSFCCCDRGGRGAVWRRWRQAGHQGVR